MCMRVSGDFTFHTSLRHLAAMGTSCADTSHISQGYIVAFYIKVYISNYIPILVLSAEHLSTRSHIVLSLFFVISIFEH